MKGGQVKPPAVRGNLKGGGKNWLRRPSNNLRRPFFELRRRLREELVWQFVPCAQKPLPAGSKSICAGNFPFRAVKNRSVRDIGRSVRANFASVRAKFDLCGHFSICAGFLKGFMAFQACRRSKSNSSDRACRCREPTLRAKTGSTRGRGGNSVLGRETG